MKFRKYILLIFILLSLATVIIGCGKKESKIDCLISKDPEFGSVQLMVAPEEFINAGFEYGDGCTIEFSNGAKYEDIPFYDGYYRKTGELAIVAYPRYEYNVFTRCQVGNVWDEAGFKDGDSVTIRVVDRGKYIDVQNALSMTYSYNRDEYSEDFVFANFRVMNGGNLKADTFYRGASPVDNKYNRAHYANNLIEKIGINYILDLADTDENISEYRSKDDFDSDYAISLYDAGKVYTAGLTVAYRNEDYVAKTVDMLNTMTEYEGPYYIHCTEGKDRTGFICLLVESIAGYSYDELKADYMETYDNYYGINNDSDPVKYENVVDLKFNDMIFWLAGVNKAEDATLDRLSQGAHDYLINAGMTEEEYQKLVDTITSHQ